jgi:hypothetical protein
LQANLQIVSNDPHLDRSEAIRRLCGAWADRQDEG